MNETEKNEKAYIGLRCWQFQKDAWQKEAETLNLSLTDFVIRKIDSPFSPVDDAQINEIKASQVNSEFLIFEIAQSCQESGTFTEEQYNTIMDELKNVSEKIDEEIKMINKKMISNRSESSKSGRSNGDKSKNEFFDYFADDDDGLF